MTDSRCIKGESKGELIELCYCCGMPSGNVIIVPLSRFPLSAARRVPLGIIGTHTFVNTIATAAISRASVIDAWLQDVVFACCRQDCASPKRRRSSSPASPTKRRRPLRPLVANALTMTSPSSDLAFDDEKTPRPRRRSPRKPSRDITPSFVLTAANDVAQAQAPAPASKSYVAELALASNSIAFSQPSASRSSSRSRRSASPVKGLADLTFDNGFKTVTRSQLQDGELGGGMDDVFEKLMEFEQKRQFSQLHPGSARELPGWLAAERRLPHRSETITEASSAMYRSLIGYLGNSVASVHVLCNRGRDRIIKMIAHFAL